MKRACLFFIAVALCTICKGQTGPVLPPSKTSISKKHAKRLIHQTPTSFILNTTNLISYFNAPRGATPGLVTNKWYLHIYLATDKASRSHDLRLIIIPSVILQPDASEPENIALEHDPNFLNAFVPCAWNGSPNFCYIPDNDIDGIAFATAPRCNLGAMVCSDQIAINDPRIDAWIKQYETDHPQQNGHVQSFIFDATDLRTFLLAPNNVPYIQIYFGVDNKNQSNPELYNTFVFVGLDDAGNHIPLTADANKFALEECRPCPICGIMQDALIPDASVAGIPQTQIFNIVEEIETTLIDSLKGQNKVNGKMKR